MHCSRHRCSGKRRSVRQVHAQKTVSLSVLREIEVAETSIWLNRSTSRLGSIPLPIDTQRLESIYQRKLAALDELKKSLLHRAFTGEL